MVFMPRVTVMCLWLRFCKSKSKVITAWEYSSCFLLFLFLPLAGEFPTSLMSLRNCSSLQCRIFLLSSDSAQILGLIMVLSFSLPLADMFGLLLYSVVLIEMVWEKHPSYKRVPNKNSHLVNHGDKSPRTRLCHRKAGSLCFNGRA